MSFGLHFGRLRPRTTVVVHTRDDKTVKGVHMRSGRWGVELAQATLLVGTSEHPLAGSTLLPFGNISFIQRLEEIA